MSNVGLGVKGFESFRTVIKHCMDRVIEVGNTIWFDFKCYMCMHVSKTNAQELVDDINEKQEAIRQRKLERAAQEDRL